MKARCIMSWNCTLIAEELLHFFVSYTGVHTDSSVANTIRHYGMAFI